jgi:tetratricopeptide (TPR) repeat protein
MTEEPPMRLGSAEVSDSGAVAGRDFNLRARFGAGRDINIGSVVEATTAVEARHQLPPDVADFTDREREAADVRRALEDPEGRGGVALVAGKPGVGKSALAIHLAHALSAQFPDAQLYVDLRGGEPAEHLDPLTPTEVLAGFLRALGIEQVPEQPAERVAFYRAQLAHKRALVVLDNASREDQVRPLIPGSRSCAVLVTSRMQLPGLEGARPRELEVLDPGAALELLAKLIGDRDRLERERDAAEAIVRLCGYLPLAVRIAGSRLRTRPRWSLHKLVERLADERRRLDELRAGDREVRASFALSYRELKDDEARLFRRLGVFPGPDFGVALAGALVDTSSDEAEELLERLVDVRLLEEVGEERYRFHDLLRLFARERLEADETPPARQAAGARALGWLLEGASAANSLLSPGPPGEGLEGREPEALRSAALAWFETERANLVAAVDQAHRVEDSSSVLGLTDALTEFFSLRSHWSDWQQTHELALDAARNAGDRHGEARTLNNLGLVYANHGRWQDAIANYEQSLETYRALGDRHGEAQTLNNLGNVYADQGRWQDAIANNEQSLETFRALGDRHGEAQTLNNLGNVYRRQGRWQDAIAYYEQSLAIKRALGDRHGEAQTLANFGAVFKAKGEQEEAVALWRSSLAILDALDAPEAEQVRAWLAG